MRELHLESFNIENVGDNCSGMIQLLAESNMSELKIYANQDGKNYIELYFAIYASRTVVV